MLATSIAMATFTGGPVGREMRKEKQDRPPSLSYSLPPSLFSPSILSLSTFPSISSLHNPPISIPPNIVPFLKQPPTMHSE